MASNYTITPASDELFHDALMTYPGAIRGANLNFHPNDLAAVPAHAKDVPAYIRACQVRNVVPFYHVTLAVNTKGDVIFRKAELSKETPEWIEALIHNSRPNEYAIEVNASDLTTVRENLLPKLLRQNYHFRWGMLVLSTESSGYQGGSITADRYILFGRPSVFGPGGIELQLGRQDADVPDDVKEWFETLRAKHVTF